MKMWKGMTKFKSQQQPAQPNEYLVDPQIEQEEVNPPIEKAKKNKAQAKSAPPDAVTCSNTYFHVSLLSTCATSIAVMFCVQVSHQLWLNLMQGGFDTSSFSIDLLVVTYFYDEDEDYTILAFPGDECWDQVGIDADFAKRIMSSLPKTFHW